MGDPEGPWARLVTFIALRRGARLRPELGLILGDDRYEFVIGRVVVVAEWHSRPKMVLQEISQNKTYWFREKILPFSQKICYCLKILQYFASDRSRHPVGQPISWSTLEQRKEGRSSRTGYSGSIQCQIVPTDTRVERLMEVSHAIGGWWQSWLWQCCGWW
ncbi:hypothetical protein CRG98_011960 [Punica granatum]|uniref:Uncharacterized protein n=1 Tax=Punica granatum TaxID=22663 RepID=A0A2I0KGV2_PUNGR|nr:hypothetical protein CRG98_011960 [Punica granatum]